MRAVARPSEPRGDGRRRRPHARARTHSRTMLAPHARACTSMTHTTRARYTHTTLGPAHTHTRTRTHARTCTHRDARTYARTHTHATTHTHPWNPPRCEPSMGSPPPCGARECPCPPWFPTGTPRGAHGEPSGLPRGTHGVTHGGYLVGGGGEAAKTHMHGGEPYMSINDVHAHIGVYAGASMRAHCRATSSQRAASTCPPATGATAPGAHGVGLPGVVLTHGCGQAPSRRTVGRGTVPALDAPACRSPRTRTHCTAVQATHTRTHARTSDTT
jgi:hypothetical protein